MNFFIVGVGRSGTSLLQSILSSHSKICIPPETGFIRENVLSRKKTNDFTREQLISANKKAKRILSALPDKLPQTFLNELDFYHSLLELYLSSQNKELAGDKDPRLVEFIAAVSMLFPAAQFIHLVRDPRDVLLSKKNAEWSRNRPGWYHIFANYIQLRLGEWFGKKLPKDKYLVITYENILSAPESTVTKVCDFLSVNFEKEMLSFQDKAKELVSEEEKQWKKETMGPLLKNNTGKWRGKLTDREVALTELLCEQAFNIGGYKKSDSMRRLSFVEKNWLKFITLVLKGGGIFYMMYRLISQKTLVKWKY